MLREFGRSWLNEKMLLNDIGNLFAIKSFTNRITLSSYKSLNFNILDLLNVDSLAFPQTIIPYDM